MSRRLWNWATSDPTEARKLFQTASQASTGIEVGRKRSFTEAQSIGNFFCPSSPVLKKSSDG
jgi:hypothetical protein